MIRGFILLGVAIVFNGIANVLLKKGMSGDLPLDTPTAMLKHIMTSWPVLLGLGLFALNVVAYTQALSRLPLSVAYPIMVSLTGLIVISSSLVLFKEHIGGVQWMGFALIIGGVIMVAK